MLLKKRILAYDKYKDIIDYTYERTTVVPKKVKVYGYPVVIDDDLKNLAIQNIKNFVPAENEVEITADNFDDYLTNEVEITADNFDDYLTNSYLDTTIPRREKFSYVLCLVIIILIIVILMFILTIFDQDRKVYRKVEGVYQEKKKKLFSRK